tara:strand:- start:517 stop:921 length:405 start_codon:yes stop_codon:yes gene_type:complete
MGSRLQYYNIYNIVAYRAWSRIHMGILMDIDVMGTRQWVVNFYQEQLDYFNKIGLGKYTTHGVKVTSQLIKVTQKRLDELTLVYDASLTPQALKLRKLRLRREKLQNGSTDSNGAAEAKGCEDIRTDGHERSKS